VTQRESDAIEPGAYNVHDPTPLLQPDTTHSPGHDGHRDTRTDTRTDAADEAVHATAIYPATSHPSEGVAPKVPEVPNRKDAPDTPEASAGYPKPHPTSRMAQRPRLYYVQEDPRHNEYVQLHSTPGHHPVPILGGFITSTNGSTHSYHCETPRGKVTIYSTKDGHDRIQHRPGRGRIVPLRQGDHIWVSRLHTDTITSSEYRCQFQDEHDPPGEPEHCSSSPPPSPPGATHGHGDMPNACDTELTPCVHQDWNHPHTTAAETDTEDHVQKDTDEGQH
jgi:translation initiation factor IF-1